MTRHLVTAAALGVALVSPALAGTKPTAPIARVAAPVFGQQTFDRMRPITSNCSTASFPANVAGRCSIPTATPIISIASRGAFTNLDGVTFDRSDVIRCASSAAFPVAAVLACRPKTTVNAGDFSADTYTRTNLRVSPPIIVIRCEARAAVATPVPPWCRPQPVVNSRDHAVPVLYYRHHWDPPQFGLSLQLGSAAPRVFGTINP